MILLSAYLLKSDGNSIEIPPGHSALGRETLGQNEERFPLFRPPPASFVQRKAPTLASPSYFADIVHPSGQERTGEITCRMVVPLSQPVSFSPSDLKVLFQLPTSPWLLLPIIIQNDVAGYGIPAHFWQNAWTTLPAQLSKNKGRSSTVAPRGSVGVWKAITGIRGSHSINDRRLHDLRHSFATWLRQQGVELDVIASQLGHRDLRMTKRYGRIAAAQVKQAVNGLDSVFGNAPDVTSGATRYPSATETLPVVEQKVLSALN